MSVDMRLFAGLTVDSAAVQAKIEVAENAAPGPRTITVRNPDRGVPLFGKFSVV